MELYNQQKSNELFNRALKVIPTGVYGHLGPSTGCFIPVSAFPIFSERAKGSYIWDADGQRYIDYMSAYGTNILGYCDDDVDDAASKQLRIGNNTTTPNKIVIDYAELIVNTVTSADWCFFAKNGGDVTNLAVMTARAATGRKKLIRVKEHYHGVHPWAQKLGYPGVIEEDVVNNLFVHWNDFDELSALVNAHENEVAAFIATPYHHPVFEDNVYPENNYWQKVRELCTKKGIVLIVDDVRCGFRLSVNGSDSFFGFKADLICFCKALANGYAVSALCGTDSLKDAVSNITYTGSYWLGAEPFAAGIACVNKMIKLDSGKLCAERGTKLSEGLQACASRNGFNLKVSGSPSMFYMRIADDDSLFLHQAWVAECVRRGVLFTNHHNQFMNCSLTDEDIEFTLNVADNAFNVIKNKI